MWFQVFISNTNKFQTDGTLTGTTAADQSGHGSNGNEEVYHAHQSSKIRASSLELGYQDTPTANLSPFLA